MRFLPLGERAVLVEVGTLDDVLALDAAVQAAPPTGLVDVVPAERTLLLRVAEPGQLPAVVRHVEALEPASVAAASGPEVVVDVRYDGPDLVEVARLTGLGEEEVVAAHTGSPWRVGFVGFAPGFAYLVGGDPRLVVPRRATPRTRVPAGSVALAGGYSAVYPRSTPGGWQLVGSSQTPLWDLAADPPTPLRPGVRVRFRSVS